MTTELLQAMETLLGPGGVLQGDDVTTRPGRSMGMGQCQAAAILRPSSTSELAEVMALCHAHKQVVVPLGGLTGLVDGFTCNAGDVAISLERMSHIESVDTVAGTMTVEAGVPLQTVQQRADEDGWYFGLDLGARGSCTIGGNIATNAGGNSVIRYGMMREQVLGLEAVLADGTVISSMNQMLKNNAGYDLKQLFIGSEGTLGIVTRAVLRLRPLPGGRQTALAALNSFSDVTKLLRHLGTELEGTLSAFETLWQSFYKLMVVDSGKHQAFLPANYPFYVLLEAESANADQGSDRFTSVLAQLLESELIVDAVIAQSTAQANHLWAMRDDVETMVAAMFPPAIFDISLPLGEMEGYLEHLNVTLDAEWSDINTLTFGHLGDGNIHLLIGPVQDDAMYQEVQNLVYESLSTVHGSISAEHGIGLQKKAYLACSRSEAEISMMKTLKLALDPLGILNPGKIF